MSTNRTISLGFIGFGTVGAGAVKVLLEHKKEISRRLGAPIKIAAICSPNIAKRDTSWVPEEVIRTTNADAVINDPEIDIIIETIGGLEPAKSYLLQAIAQGKAIITANKLLLAEAGHQLVAAATEKNLSIGIEAAVAGGIPILNGIREGLAGEKIESIYGILNGTTNFILTEMESSGRNFQDILAEAQKLGYAEADPTLDVEGFDARDKLAILLRMAFGFQIAPQAIPTEGITRLLPVDFLYANHLGYTIRLLCVAKRVGESVTASVAPTLISKRSLLARVESSYNCALINGHIGGRTVFYGRGAGSGPTGIAIVSDIIRIAREMHSGVGNLSSPFGYQHLENLAAPHELIDECRFSLRFVVNDRPGIIAKLATILEKHEISIEAVVHEKLFEDKKKLPFVIAVGPTSIGCVHKALTDMKAFDFLLEPPLALRFEEHS